MLKVHRADFVPLETGNYSEAEILEFNRRHDLRYGWSFSDIQSYHNPRRLPETVFGPIERYWELRDAALLPA
jgi:hypothetical protein